MPPRAPTSSSTPVDFFYHLGDVVYRHGEEAGYGAQFFSPHADYRAPIFAVPGNHDGELTPASKASTLAGFLRTFCSAAPPLHDAAVPVSRPVSAQPNVYWTLTHDWLWIVGLYTNVPEGGQLAVDQLAWLEGRAERRAATATVILAMHQPIYCVDGRQIPYLVAGSGGFHERHAVGSGLPDLPAAFPGLPG